MEFEFDPAKSTSNKTKHGLDFVEAQALWKEPRVEFAAKIDRGETRYAILGTIGGECHTAILSRLYYTYHQRPPVFDLRENTL